ncbi:MAG: bifunctional shikimate kinase/3-dehydroquinate synthase [Chloroflexota bacterium]|nr:bifunctional shikimate kinase/3-dehydroquinate synthase [Chloroflexota bacterium]
MEYQRIVLVGLSGSGKSTVARRLAERLGWRAVDSDELLEQRAGKPIPRIFAEDGEAAFRALESAALADACREPRTVVATGGGSVTVEANWPVMRRDALVVHLGASPETLLCRLDDHARRAGQNVAARPLLAGADPADALHAMMVRRAAAYARADVALDTEGHAPETVANRLTALVRGEPVALWEDRFDTASHASHLVVGYGLQGQLPERIAARWPGGLSGVVLITDERVDAALGIRVRGLLAAANIPLKGTLVVPAGEASKSLAIAGDLYASLANLSVDRKTAIIALGGGVVGDLAGYVAATYLRGLPLVQIPTTLLAMVDSSVGGKTAVDLPAGKNLVGAFYQPHLVLIDPACLATLPEREMRSGWGEIVKHAFIESSVPGVRAPTLLTTLRDRAALLAAGDPLPLTSVIARNVALKLAVVRGDEREETGLRAILNTGHTAGHAIEAAALADASVDAGTPLLHGEAVALGLRAEAALAAMLDHCAADVPAAYGALLDAFGLPRRATDLGLSLDIARVLPYIARDKKTVGGTTTWLLPTGSATEARVAPYRDVPMDAVRAAILGVL